MISKEQKNRIDSIMQVHVHNAFDQIHGELEYGGCVKPSELAGVLDLYWDLGDYYEEWWNTDDEGEWT